MSSDRPPRAGRYTRLRSSPESAMGRPRHRVENTENLRAWVLSLADVIMALTFCQQYDRRSRSIHEYRHKVYLLSDNVGPQTNGYLRRWASFFRVNHPLEHSNDPLRVGSSREIGLVGSVPGHPISREDPHGFARSVRP